MSEAIRTIGKYGIELTEWKGEFGLTACYEGKDGKFYQSWGKQRVGKDAYSDKDRPIKVILGDRKSAIAALRMVLSELGEHPRPEPPRPPASDDDVPF